MARKRGWLRRIRDHRVLVHGAALVWLAGAAIVMLAPALSHGMSIGPIDLLSSYGLTSQPGVLVHNATSSDQIQQFIPWTSLAWTQVHHGQLPLWNPYSLLGMPLAFNWQSSVFSIPSLIGYLFPLNLAYTASVVLRLVIAGAGGYVLGRVMGMSWLGSTLTGTIFELSGPMSGWAGWAQSDVLVWAGWALAATLLLLRGLHRTRDTVFLAFAVAFAIYGGHPESILLLLVFLFVVSVVLLGIRAIRHGVSQLFLGVNVMVAVVAGIAIAAPLVLPGLQVVRESARNASASGFAALPPSTVVGFVFSSFYGRPVAGSQWFGPLNYYEITAYVGIIALVLAGVALIRRWHRPEVQTVAVVGIVTLVVVYLAPLRSLLNALPAGPATDWNRALVLTALPIAVLAGLGLDVLVAGISQRRTLTLTFAGFGAGALVLIVLAAFASESRLKGSAKVIREDSFLWPVGATAIGLLILLFLWMRLSSGPNSRVGHAFGTAWIAGLVLLVVESAFLISSGAPLWSASPKSFPKTAAVTTLRNIVGSSTVGFANCPIHGYAQLGILPNANLGYSLSEFTVYDPLVATGYYKSWSSAIGRHIAIEGHGPFCPSITNATLARTYGVAFVLQKAGGPPVVGADFDRRIDGEDLYRVPGAAPATLVSIKALGTDGAGAPIAVTHPSPTTWRIESSATSARELRLRLTDVPGWHATLDGHPLALSQWAGIMLEARVPPGRHVVVVQYEPTLFTVGLLVSAATIVVMVVLVIFSIRRRSQSVIDP